MNNTEYFSIAESIKAEILAGVYSSKGKLPSKTEFAQKYGVSKSTIQNSLEILKREGYIVSIPKSGIYVKEKSNSTYCLSEPEDEQTFYDIQKSAVVPFDPAFFAEADYRDIPENANILCLQKEYMSLGITVRFDVDFIVVKRAFSIANNEASFLKSMEYIKREIHLQMDTCKQEISAKTMTPADMQLFKSKKNHPVLVIHKYYYDRYGKLIAGGLSLRRQECAHLEARAVR